MNIILFGPPGAGKGTQAQLIAKKYNYFQLSTGDLLRNETKNNTVLGKKIDSIISKGNFVSDEIINKLLKQTILNLKFKNKIIFDGYPRNIDQANNLELILNEFNEKIKIIISLNVSREIVKKRIMGRVTCDKCNLTLNEFFNEEEIKNHECGRKFFIKRNDDNLKIIMSRYDIYKKTTQPVLNFLSKKPYFKEIDGSLSVNEITKKIEGFINV